MATLLLREEIQGVELCTQTQKLVCVIGRKWRLLGTVQRRAHLLPACHYCK